MRFLSLTIYKGATFEQTELFDAETDISSWTGKMEIRTHPTSNTVELLLTDGNGRLVLNSNGTVDFLIDEVDTAAFTFNSAVFDVFLTDPSGSVTVHRAFEGRITAVDSITS